MKKSKWMRISRALYERMKQDIQDYESACQTIFERCECGRMSERGIRCPGCGQ